MSGPAQLITTKEVKVAIEKMKNGKTPGPDEIPAEIGKMLGDQGIELLAALFHPIINNNKPLQIWVVSIMMEF